MDKFRAVLDLFRTGTALSQPGLWQKRAAAVLALSAFLMGLSYALKVFCGVDLGLTNDDANAIAGGIVTLVGLFITLTTRRDVGILPPKSDTAPAAPAGEPAYPQAGADNGVASGGEIAPPVQPTPWVDRNSEDTMRAGG